MNEQTNAQTDFKPPPPLTLLLLFTGLLTRILSQPWNVSQEQADVKDVKCKNFYIYLITFII